jgi:DeoR family transcriptional regulator, suf operon transcriptional repressor
MVNSALGGLSETRRKLVLLVKSSRELTVDELSEQLGITRSAVRQHVGGLEAAGLLEHVAERGRPGRPRFRYILTQAAERLFPGRSDEVFADVLAALDERHPGLSTQLFREHFANRTADLPGDIGEKPIDRQVSQLVKVLEDDGHMPALETMGPDSWQLTSTNCPLARVPEGRPAVCEAELGFFRAIAPSTEIKLVQRMSDDTNSCVHLLTAGES